MNINIQNKRQLELTHLPEGDSSSSNCIKCDYLTVTSTHVSLRKFFFKVLKKLKNSLLGLKCRKKKLLLGGPAYIGLSWDFNNCVLSKKYKQDCFVGYRWNNQTLSYEYILTIAGENANKFILELLESSNLTNGEWQITRIDIQLTLTIEVTVKETKQAYKATPGVLKAKKRTARTSKFKKEIILVVEAHKSFVKMLSPKISQITQKEYNYLKAQLPVKLWRIAWNTANKWAIVPTEENPIWEDIYQPIPPNNQKKAQQKRKNALKFLANKLNQIVSEFPKLLAPNYEYTMERNFNSLFKEIFNAIVKDPIIDETIKQMPKKKYKYPQSFNEYSENVQAIIREHARKKDNWS